MPELQRTLNLGDLLKYEASHLYSRDRLTVVAGQTLPLGAVVGIVTATGKVKQLDPAATDGSEVAAGVLLQALRRGAGRAQRRPDRWPPRHRGPTTPWCGRPASPPPQQAAADRAAQGAGRAGAHPPDVSDPEPRRRSVPTAWSIMQNPFQNPGFSMASLTAAINLLPNRYGRLEALNLFPAKPVRTRSVVVEEQQRRAQPAADPAAGPPGHGRMRAASASCARS